MRSDRVSVGHSVSHTLDFMTEDFDLSRHVILTLLHLLYVVDSWEKRVRRRESEEQEGVPTFAQDLPLAGLHASVGRELVAELVKEITHLLPPLPLCEFMRHSQLGGARVRS